MVVARSEYGGDHVFYGHPELGDGARKGTRGEWKLGLVGFFVDGNAHGFCVCSVVAPFGCFDGHRIL